MKNKILRILSLGLAVITALSTSTPVFAYDVDEHDDSIESVEYQNAEDEDFLNATNVFAQLGSEYKVTIPKIIVFSGTSKDARFFVKVAGDIAGYEQINVIPDENFLLYSKNKDSQTATINQDKIVWQVADFDTDAIGVITAKDITAGKWQGTFNFNVNLSQVAGDIVLPEHVQTEPVRENEIDATCTQEGSYDEVVYCEDCGEELSRTKKTVTAIGHKYSSYEVTKEATCTADGIKTATCSVCGDEKTQTISKLGHVAGKEETIIIKEATCTERGSHYVVKYCANCNSEISKIEVEDAALGHNYVNYKCTRCNKNNTSIAGLYDENDNLLYTWEDLTALGLNIEMDNWTGSSNKTVPDGTLYSVMLKLGEYTRTSTKDTSSHTYKRKHKLVIPNTVTKIGRNCVSLCDSLESVVIPNSVTSIGMNGFNCCKGLESVTIPNSVTSIGMNAFYQVPHIYYKGSASGQPWGAKAIN